MKKSTKSIVLALTPLVLAGCGSTKIPSPKIESKVNLYFAYSHENLLNNIDYQTHKKYKDKFADRGYELNFECLKGENDAVQLMMHAFKDVNNYDVKITTSLQDESGHVIADDNIQILAAWYQYVNVSNEPDAMTGYYPDALIPLENYKMRDKNYIPRNKNQSIYFNLNVPVDTVAGTYYGEATLTVDRFEYTVPLSAVVHETVMTEENHFRGSFLIWYDQIPIGEKENDTGKDFEEKYYDFIASKRISPDGLPDYYEANPERFAEKMVEVANNKKISLYRFPVQAIHGSNIPSRIESYMNALIAKNIELRNKGDMTTNLFEKLYFYINDEPSSKAYPEVRANDRAVYLAKKAAKDKLAGYPDLQKSVMEIENCVTTPFNDQLVGDEDNGGVQCWCPQFQHFNLPEDRNLYKQRQQTHLREGGENVWWYGCMDPQSPFPSYHLNVNTINSRVIPLMQFDYGVEAEIYWNVCWYSKEAGGVNTTRDYWYDPITWEDCAGDGQLVYPGYDFNIEGPITTLRLENILAGNEEFEYLYMLNEYVNQYNSIHGTSKDLNQMLAKQYAKLFTNMIIDVDSIEIETVRRNLMTALDKCKGNLDSGITYLESLGA